MELVIDGPLKLYRFHFVTEQWNANGSFSYRKASRFYLLKGTDTNLFDIGDKEKDFKELVSKYLSDVKEASDKVSNGAYKRRQIENIVREYNRLKAG